MAKKQSYDDMNSVNGSIDPGLLESFEKHFLS